jgi:hypothetical protein
VCIKGVSVVVQKMSFLNAAPVVYCLKNKIESMETGEYFGTINNTKHTLYLGM